MDAWETLTGRGLDAGLLSRLGARPAGSAGQRGIAWTYRQGGRPLRHALRAADDDRLLEAKGPRLLWNLDVLADAGLAGQPVVVAATEAEAVAAIQAGFPRTVAVPDGRSEAGPGEIHAEAFAWLEPIRQLLASEPKTPIILAMPLDQAGCALRERLAIQIDRAVCKWVPYGLLHPPALRLGDLLYTGGDSLVRAALDVASWVAVEGIYRLSELPPAPPRPAFDPGLGELGRHCRLRTGDLLVVTGIPSMGKTTFLNNLLCSMARNHGWTSAFFSPEQDPIASHVPALRRWYLGQEPTQASIAERDDAELAIERHHVFLAAGRDDDPTLDWLLAQARTAAIRHGVRALVVDPWNEVSLTDAGSRESPVERLNQDLRRLRRLGQDYGMLIIVCAHPTKQYKLEDGTFQVPSLYDVSGGAQWYNKCDLGIVIHRFGERTLIRIAKSRDHRVLGTPRDLEARLDPASGRFLDVRVMPGVPF